MSSRSETLTAEGSWFQRVAIMTFVFNLINLHRHVRLLQAPSTAGVDSGREQQPALATDAGSIQMQEGSRGAATAAQTSTTTCRVFVCCFKARR